MIEHPTNPDDTHDPEREVDLLITRLIDGASTADDRERFEHLAAAEPTHWRQLALRLQDANDLREGFVDATETAMRTELPRPSRIIPARMSWSMALSGWAAMIIVALTAVVLVLQQRQQQQAAPGPTMVADGSAVEHYERYVAAPFVLGEMQPVVVEVDVLPDGRIAVHFIRRIEEVAFLDPNDLPVDEGGELTPDLRRLRELERGSGM
jgi:hypothetical protein